MKYRWLHSLKHSEHTFAWLWEIPYETIKERDAVVAASKTVRGCDKDSLGLSDLQLISIWSK